MEIISLVVVTAPRPAPCAPPGYSYDGYACVTSIPTPSPPASATPTPGTSTATSAPPPVRELPNTASGLAVLALVIGAVVIVIIGALTLLGLSTRARQLDGRHRPEWPPPLDGDESDRRAP